MANPFLDSDVQEPKKNPFLDITPESTSKTTEKPGFLERTSTDMLKRANEGADAIVAYRNKEQGLPATALDLVGKMGAGTVGDIIGETGKSAVNATPEFIKKPVGEFLNTEGKFLAETPVGKAGIEAARQGAEAYDKWAKANPNAARHVESAVDITSLYPGGKAADSAAKGVGVAAKELGAVAKKGGEVIGPSLEKGGNSLIARAAKQAKEAKDKYLHDLISPKETQSVKEANVGRTEEKGLFRQKQVIPTAREKEIAETVGKVEGVSHKNSLQGNYNAIAKANKAEGNALMKSLESKDIPVDSKEFGEKLQETMTELGKHPYIVGDAEKSAQKVMDGMVSIAAKNPMSVSGLLKTRREFDQWVERLKGEGIFTPKKDDPVTSAVHKIRQTLNDYVESKVPDVNYKASLRKQSNLYRAMDNLEIKAAGEGKNSLSRAWQKAMALVPGKNLLEKEGALGVAGGGALLASHLGVPLAAPAAVGGLGYGAYKAATSPTAKKILGSAMSKTGQMIGKEKPLLKLTYQPKTDYVVGRDAVAKQVNPMHDAVMQATRERMNKLGLTSDILHAQDLNTIHEMEKKYGQSELGKFVKANKNEPIMGKVWEVPQTEYSGEIKQAWDSHQVPLADMILSSRKAAEELSKITGKPQVGSLGEAMYSAVKSPIADAAEAITP